MQRQGRSKSPAPPSEVGTLRQKCFGVHQNTVLMDPVLFSFVRSKCPDLPESDVQLLGTELLCAEILFPGRSTKEEFATWLASMTESDLKEILSVRKGFNDEANSELAAFREEQAEIQRQREEVQKRYKEQVAKARKERTMAFNPQSGKFEEIKKK